MCFFLSVLNLRRSYFENVFVTTDCCWNNLVAAALKFWWENRAHVGYPYNALTSQQSFNVTDQIDCIKICYTLPGVR